jgi:hypothetical protein
MLVVMVKNAVVEGMVGEVGEGDGKSGYVIEASGACAL